MKQHLLQWAMLELIDALTDDVIRTDAMANELEGAAAEPSLQVDAGALRDAARRRRVQALELRGQLAALHEEFAERFPLKL